MLKCGRNGLPSASYFVRELIDVRPCMLFPCLRPGLLFGGPALLDLTLQSVEFTCRLTEMISEKFNRRVFQLAFRQAFGQATVC